MKRIHELAKEQGVDSSQIIEVLKRAGLPESKCTPSSTISPEWEQRLMPLFDRLREAQRRQAAAAEAAKASRARGAGSAASTGRASSRRGGKAAARSATSRGSRSSSRKASGASGTKARKKAESKPKRWTEDTVAEAVPAAEPASDAWVEIEEYERARRAEKAAQQQQARAEPKKAEEPLAPRAPAVARRDRQGRGHAAGLAARGWHRRGGRRTARAGCARVAAGGPACRDTGGCGGSRAGGGGRAPRPRPLPAPRRSASASGARSARRRPPPRPWSWRGGSNSSVLPAPAAPRRLLRPPPPEEEEEEEVTIGRELLGDVPEEDEQIVTAFGGVAAHPDDDDWLGAGGRRGGKVRRRERGAREDEEREQPVRAGAGFERGRGFSLGPSVVAGESYPQRVRGGRGKRFFRVTGGGRGRGRGRAQTVQRTDKPSEVSISPPVTIKDLSAALGVRVPDIIRYLMRQGRMMRQNDVVDEELALEIGLEFGIDVHIKKKAEAEELLADLAAGPPDDPKDLVPRAPIITILGHVDHGKTTLLDKIRKSRVAQSEAGGITQHIGAYKVELGEGRSVVFVDTPGHEAFTEMRARGANVTDVVVLVVAADDGVMPQTEEAYNHAKAAGVPVVVALTKIDKPEANPMRAKQQLSGLGLQPVEWGGQTEVIEVSGLTGQGIDNLLETLWLQAEILELKANPRRPATGTCLEARKTEGRGIVANLLVQNGTLRPGDVLVCGTGYGRVRALFDDRGRSLREAGPSTPVEVIGLEDLPEAGARFYVLPELAQAKRIAQARQQERRQLELAQRSAVKHTRLEDVFARLKAGETQEVRIVLKADVRGSLEVLQKELANQATEEVGVRVLHAAVGGITESDVLLADASDAIVIGFNVVPDERAQQAAEQKGVDIRTYRVIYNVLEDLRLAMEGLLAPEAHEEVIGELEVRKVFRSSQVGTIAGCYVAKGRIDRSAKVRVIRDGVIKYEGEVASLRRHKDDVREVREGFECGVTIKDYQDIREGDRLQVYEVKMVARTLT
ncbi:MAG: hypothetical protein KatS3mg102_0249 [Planctomycetota bacterium]|nr:MAG: hypothetical protein KatS3mg102_0249 [Planctomycetota bacterium]